jgi:predicted regulator of Ras-like GTPase activity (Roadblock/LC7/MglB family)
MADIPQIEEILKEIESQEGVHGAFLVTRSGVYIAGTLPKTVDKETYASMFAVLLGSADTATSQIQESLQAVVVHLRDSKLVVVGDGPKALFVLRVNEDVTVRRLREVLRPYSARLEEHL